MKKLSYKAIQVTIALLATLFVAGATSSPPRYALARQPESAGMGQAAGPQVPTGTGFTYHGSLKNGGVPANGQYDFQFKLYDALSGGAQVGSTLTVSSQTVTDGLFTAQLDFGAGAFVGDARWLEIAVRQMGGGTYTTLSPRQPITATPYASSLILGAAISGTVAGPGLVVTNTSSTGVYGRGNGNAYGVQGVGGMGVRGEASVVDGVGTYGYSTSGYGVEGVSSNGTGGYFSSTDGVGVVGTSVTNDGIRGYSTALNAFSGVAGFNDNGGYGVFGRSNAGGGMWGLTQTGTGVIGSSTSITNGIGVKGTSAGANGYGVLGQNTNITNGSGVKGTSVGEDGYGVLGVNLSNGIYASGVAGQANMGTGVYGLSVSSQGVIGQNISGTSYGVEGQGGTGVRGVSTSATNGVGVWGESNTGNGVLGTSSSSSNSGVAGTNSSSGAGLYGWSSAGLAAWLNGNVTINGICTGCFGPDQIDHPLDPENKYLSHVAVQSDDMLDIYSGNVTTDARGEVVVTLPDWFEALNKDFRYQLTPIGQFAQAIVASEIKDNRFTIKTDKPNVKVSWLVTGVRKDPYAQAHPIQPEVEKPADEKGKYLHPELYGQPESKGIGYEDRQKMQQASPKPPEQPKP